MTQQDSSTGIDIFVPDHSRGLMIDALVLRAALGGMPARIISVPVDCYRSDQRDNDAELDFDPGGEVALFIESVFEHRNLIKYSRRILLPNPEWIYPADMETLSRTITEFWHKTRLSMDQLQRLFPDSRHIRTGFTTPAVRAGEQDFSVFGHFAGRGHRWRHTQMIVDLWLEKPAYPSLTLHSYHPEFLNIPLWLTRGNMRIRTGYLDNAEYLSEVSRHGIQLCTSQMEGFGHYINEARSLGALVVTVDAAPMNELISRDCGVLVPVDRSKARGCGVRSSVSRDALQQAIEAVLAMPVAARRSMGRIACERYLQEQQEFLERIRAVL